jgi:hypothetical protein
VARQPLIVAALVAACDANKDWDGTFDVPDGITTLSGADRAPFDRPVAYVASAHGGRIAVLSPQDGRYLADDPTASFSRAAPLATGASRVLGDLAAITRDDGSIDVFAADRGFGVVVRVPHVAGLAGGQPTRAPVSASDVLFVDADASGDAPTLLDLEALEGFASTEAWTVTFDGERWWPRGTRSGRLESGALPDEDHVDTRGGLAFRVEGSATAGDQFTFRTDNGLVEIDVGGTPLALAASPDGLRLAAVVAPDGADPVLRWLDPIDGAPLSDVPLAPGARPARLAWSADGAALFVADVGRSAFWEVVPGDVDVVTEHVVPAPTGDVAALHLDGRRTAAAVAADGRTVWLYDLDAAALRDLNPLEPGVNGLVMDSIVRGVGAVADPFRWTELDDGGVPVFGHVFALSLHRGVVVLLGESTGCLVRDAVGPRSVSVVQGQSQDWQVVVGDADDGPFLQTNSTNSGEILVNRCGGVAWEEAWTLTYDASLAGWRVEGSLSGPQTRVAYEDTRYLSDRGSVSFVVRSGRVPTEDGWRIRFGVDRGVFEANGDNQDSTGADVSFSLPGRPVAVRLTDIAPGGGYNAVQEAPFVLVPAAGSDLVGRVDLRTGVVDTAWW